MKIITKLVLNSTLLFLILFSFTGCGVTSPDTITKNFMDAVKAQDFAKAVTFIKSDKAENEFKYDSPEQEKLVKAIFSKIEYQIDKPIKSGTTAKVKVKITSVDLPNITSKMISELLPTLMAQALSGNTTDKSKQDEMFMQYYINSINSPSVPKTTTDVELNLVKEKEGWLIQPNDELLNAMTGNMQKAFQSMQSGGTTESKK